MLRLLAFVCFAVSSFPSLAHAEESAAGTVRAEFTAGAKFEVYSNGIIIPWMGVGGALTALGPTGWGIRLAGEAEQSFVETRPGFMLQASAILPVSTRLSVELVGGYDVVPAYQSGYPQRDLAGGLLGVSLQQGEHGTATLFAGPWSTLGVGKPQAVIWTLGFRVSVF